MFVFELKVKIPNKDLEEKIIEKLKDFLIDQLFKTKQILYRDLPIIKEYNEFKAIVECAEFDSLESKNRKYYVNQYWEELEDLSENKIEIKYLGKEYLEYTKCCGIQSFLILYSDSLYSSIRCGDCFEPIPFYFIPPTYEYSKEYFDIFSWEKNYDSCYNLWFSGEIGEQYHLKQLSNFDSNLTKQGLKVCRNIEKVTNKPVYYFLMSYKKISFKKDKKRTCPSCNKEWILNNTLHKKFDFKCDSCKLISELNH
ncbi:MAG: DUF2310 family Zn-ribbon-containing protein [Candidatus Sericytochromatia bacterium]